MDCRTHTVYLLIKEAVNSAICKIRIHQKNVIGEVFRLTMKARRHRDFHLRRHFRRRMTERERHQNVNDIGTCHRLTQDILVRFGKRYAVFLHIAV